jgi:DNA-binding transcriptional ArsR family regulator
MHSIDVGNPQVDLVLDALGDPTRRAIVSHLKRGPQSLSTLSRPLGVTVTAVSQHVRVLERCGLLTSRKVGRVRSCQLDSAGLDVLDGWIRETRAIWEGRLDRLGEILADDDG